MFTLLAYGQGIVIKGADYLSLHALVEKSSLLRFFCHNMLWFRPQALVIATDDLFDMLRFKIAAQKKTICCGPTKNAAYSVRLYAAGLTKPQHIVLHYMLRFGEAYNI